MSRGFPAGFRPPPPPPPGMSPPFPIFPSLPIRHTLQFSPSMAMPEGQVAGPHSSSISQNLHRPPPPSIVPPPLPPLPLPSLAFDRHAEALMDLAPGTSISSSGVAEARHLNREHPSFPPNVMVPAFPTKAKDLSFPRTADDVKRLVLELRGLISQARQAADDILNSAKINRDALPVTCVDASSDTLHMKKMTNESSDNLRIKRMTNESSDNLHMKRMTNESSDNLHLKRTTNESIGTDVVLDGTDSFTKAKKLFSNLYEILKSDEDPRNAFFYSDAPAVVQMQAYTDVSSHGTSTLPEFAMGEIWTELVSCNAVGRDSCTNPDVLPATLLPSQLCSFEKEIDRWNCLPSKLSPAHLEVMHNFARVRIGDLKRFLLLHLPSYTVIPYRRKHVDHILFLLVFCLRAVHRRSVAYTLKSGLKGAINEQKEASGVESQLVDCRVLSDSASWFSSKLSPICYPEATKNLVLDCYKHAFKCAIRSILAMFQQTISATNVGNEGSLVSGTGRFPEDLNSLILETHKGTILSLKSVTEDQDSLSVVDSMKEDNVPKELENLNLSTAEDNDNDNKKGMSFIGELPLSLYQLTEAIVGLEGLATSQKHIKSDSEFFSSSPYHRSVLHNMIVDQAELLRATRMNYRPVLEHDGLMWQKPQNQDTNRKKTKEEILAEERDYKRRRMSYRAKKVKRTPMQVIRDIIEGHMADIVASGGIGCVGRKPQDMPPSHESSGRVKRSNESADSSYKDRQRQGEYQGQSHSSNNAKYYKPNTGYKIDESKIEAV